MKKLVVIAFGGNALLRSGQKGSYREQIDNVAKTCQSLAHLIKRECNLIIGHGNGPQVGNVMLQHEAGSQVFDLQAMPMDFCVAETQGSIGYMIEQGMHNILIQEKIQRNVVTLVTEVLVDKDDPMFHNPTKPVGPYYTEKEAKEFAEKTGSVYRADPKGIGWRKVVASPKPIQIANIEIVKELSEKGYIVVTAGGGGIPVIRKEGYYYGIEAVIDKDLALALTAVQVGADEFYILTDIPKVYINYKKENEQAIDKMTIADAKRYLAEGQFAEGSMAPKVRAAIYFVENGGRECIITEAGELENPEAGTHIIRE
ncbi:MAG: carbamate kinase [Bacteroidales bacterium]|jgi:carbamate kinase|nr:carbamate kinase [Bacteroidales bacterium]